MRTGSEVRDVVRVERDSDGLLCFASLEEKGGHATMRVLFEESVEAEWQREILAGLPDSSGGKGIGYEKAMGHLYAVDLGLEVARLQYQTVCDYLGGYEREETLSYEEGDRDGVPYEQLGA